jgi:hypothetical protein
MEPQSAERAAASGVGVGVAKMLRFSAKVSRFQKAVATKHANSTMTKILIRDLVLRFEVISECLSSIRGSERFSSRSD